MSPSVIKGVSLGELAIIVFLTLFEVAWFCIQLSNLIPFFKFFVVVFGMGMLIKRSITRCMKMSKLKKQLPGALAHLSIKRSLKSYLTPSIIVLFFSLFFILFIILPVIFSIFGLASLSFLAAPYLMGYLIMKCTSDVEAFSPKATPSNKDDLIVSDTIFSTNKY
ncbi:hypothetical protein [Vibrio genomosp. F10]|nr:hypothetical protein [Vibrio genomosp. F10]